MIRITMEQYSFDKLMFVMRSIENKKLLIAKKDFSLLSDYLKNNKAVAQDEKNSEIVQYIKNAELIEDAQFPWEIVRLNSKVIIRDKIARINYTYTVVMPELA